MPDHFHLAISIKEAKLHISTHEQNDAALFFKMTFTYFQQSPTTGKE